MFRDFVLGFEYFIFEYQNRIFEDQQEVGLVLHDTEREVGVVLFHGVDGLEYAVLQHVESSKGSGTINFVFTCKEIGV